MQLRPTLGAALAAAILTSLVRSETVTLPALKDATLFSSATGDTADGAGDTFFAGRAGTSSQTPVRRALIAFDVAAHVPAGATITSVELKLYMTQTTSGTRAFDLYRLTSDWNEGPTIGQSGQGGTSQAGDTTWLHTSYPGAFWTTPGGDFAATSSVTKNVGGPGWYTFGSTAAMVADVQGWLDAPGTSFGWILRGPEQTGQVSAKRFESSESFAPSWRPSLVITFTPPAPAVYCTAQVNSAGCAPSIGSSGTPDASSGGGFTITLSNTLNQKYGILFYGTNGPSSGPFLGGTRCVQPPVVRTPVQYSGGNPPPDDCTGSFAFDFNAHIASGADPSLGAGDSVWAQYWSRDPADPATTNLSDALGFYVQS